MLHVLTVDVEEWFNILDIPGAIPVEQWDKQESRLEPNLEKLLDLFRRHNVKVTCFWLGYFAQKYPHLVRQCAAEGHEIACHGYAHVLAYKVGRKIFGEDIRKGKAILEDIIQRPVIGFRSAGFSTTDDTLWTFEEIRSAGYLYDSSVFPATRGHGGMRSSQLGLYVINTASGDLLEIPQSVVTILGKRVSLFGGGYLRVTPYPIIRWGIRQLQKADLPLVVYVHPREIDPKHPRLKMSLWRRFKSYNNLDTTYPKLEKLCNQYTFVPMNTIPGGASQSVMQNYF